MSHILDFENLVEAAHCRENLDYIADSLDFLEYSEEDDPTMLDTPGSLADKITNVCTKMFWNQQLIYDIRNMSKEEFKERWGDNMDELHESLKRCLDLNNQRARLIQAFDERLVEAIKADGENAVMRQHKTY